MNKEEFMDKYDALAYRNIKRDGETVRQIECPGCGVWGDIDEDQYHGRISIDCPECEFHETVNISEFRSSDSDEDCGCD